MMLPQIEVTPGTALIDVPVHITLSGFIPNQLITLHATLKNGLPGGDLTASSHAIFQADENGSVDLVSQAPLFGTYEGIDPMGLFWSMNVQTMRFYHAYSLDDFQFTPRSTEIELTAEVYDKPVAKAVVKRIFVSRDVSIQKVTDNGLVGLYFSKPHTEQRPAIVVLGGSEGGIGSCSQFAALFASHDYPALALAYFQCNDLPDDIRQIPIEYVQRAIHWLQQQPAVHPEKITLFGRSKGAELALVTASLEQHVHAVIASSPSSTVSIGTDKAFTGSDTFSPQSSWSFQGEPLPFVPWTEEQTKVSQERLDAGQRIDHIHAEAWVACEWLEDTEIPVEKINGPILFLSSDDDHWWPAAEHCEQMVERLKDHQFAHSVVHLRYADTGHGIRFPYIPTTRTQLNGGTPKNNAYASEHSWREVLQFLERTFPE
ncbi:acyl-CoA thioesterase/BAAT N-terminal domain-containing protein [Brevibacillus sp. M2.1A]|uniref:acyl-CoA thioesterase/bile acid-CoA:amino acid N-acyltransferase family protein n=1 Tax=Brevibacillus sp. M2.1A TaxID=2738980 RepID=UPI00156ADFD5|nr:acyl-CoA thioesterase/bile acid-CoA:amino acid N-acyltransferase family protein [Brevibacillus sp. M2.1A]MCC8436184.1 acyl-CoA thioesterase/BAAT N-terminal domain-containing protein [Brevibacillus sp. M2.1A]